MRINGNIAIVEVLVNRLTQSITQPSISLIRCALTRTDDRDISGRGNLKLGLQKASLGQSSRKVATSFLDIMIITR